MLTCALLIHALAIHFEPGYRSDTLGAGIVCEEDDVLYAAGGFRNSEGKRSLYAVAGWQPLHLQSVRIGVVAGLINGYTYQDGKPFAMAAAVVSASLWDGAKLRIMAVPPVPGVSTGAVQFGVSQEF